MSQATPNKKDRIDRHLSRQRGAGVRNLVSSFGFSFGLPAPIAPNEPITLDTQAREPPLKRRKLEELVEEETPRIEKGDSVGKDGVVEAEKENKTSTANAITRNAPKSAQEIDDVEEQVPTKVLKARIAKPKLKPSTSKKLQQKAAEAGQANEASTVSAKPQRRRGRPKKEPLLKVDQALKIPAVSGVPKEREEGLEKEPLLEIDKDPDVPTVAEIPKRRKGRPKKELPVETEQQHDESVPLEEVQSQKARPKKKRRLELAEPEVPSRPRRQAASSAMSKVAQGFIEEEAPIDKKRRDPEPEKTVRRGRKKPVEILALPQPDSDDAAISTEELAGATENASEATQDVVIGTDQGLREEVRLNMPLSNDEPDHEPDEPSRAPKKPRKEPKSGLTGRSRKIDRPLAKSKNDPVSGLSNAKITEALDTVEESLQKTKRRPLAETNANTTLRSVSPEKCDKPIKTSRVAKSVSKEQKDGGLEDSLRLEVPPAKQVKKTTKVSVKRDAVAVSESTEDKHLPDARAQKIPTAGRIASKKTGEDENSRSEASTAIEEKHLSGEGIGQIHTAKISETDVRTSLKRPRVDERRSAQTLAAYEDNQPPSTKPQRSNRADDTAKASKSVDGRQGSKKARLGGETSNFHEPAAAEEDVDWLFDQEYVPSKPKPRARATAKRVTRQALAKMPDVDLDDLLTNIASMAHKPGRRK